MMMYWKSASDTHQRPSFNRSILQAWFQTIFLTCSMPPEGHDACRRPGGQPQREEADRDASKVSQKMRRIRHDGQTASGVSTCKQGVKPENRFFFLCKWLKCRTFLFLLTNHLSSHEDEAHGTGDAQLPPGPMPRIPVRPWCGDRLLAEPVPPPQVVVIRRALAQLRSRITTGLRWRTGPERQNSWFSNHKLKPHMKEFQTYHPRSSGWGSISCCFSEHSMSSVNPLQGLTLV